MLRENFVLFYIFCSLGEPMIRIYAPSNTVQGTSHAMNEEIQKGGTRIGGLEMEVGKLKEEDLLDPNPDIHALFCHYNELYFRNALGACTVDWSSKRMTL
jgi:hypothetical protein